MARAAEEGGADAISSDQHPDRDENRREPVTFALANKTAWTVRPGHRRACAVYQVAQTVMCR